MTPLIHLPYPSIADFLKATSLTAHLAPPFQKH